MANKTMHHLVIEDNNYEILDAKNRANIAAEYSASSTYNVGDVVLYNGQLYKCTTAISTAEAWTAAHWTAVTVGEKIADLEDDTNQLKEDFNQIFVQRVYEKDNSSPSKVFECTIVANTTYYVKNTGSVSVNVRTITSDGTEVEKIKNGITAGETVTFTATQNASYIRMYAVGVASISITINGDVLKIEDAKIAEANARIDYIDKATGLEWIVGTFINSTNGGTGSATDRACTGFIPCPELTSVSYVGENNKNTVYGIAFYNKYFALISGDSNTGTIGNETTLTTPAGTAYVRVSTLLSMLNTSYFKVNDVSKNTLANLSRIAVNAPVYVDGLNGNDTSGNGSLIAPYKTIGKAIATGAVKIGLFPTATYSETVNIDGKNIHIFTYTNSTSEFSDQTPNRPKATISGGSTALTIQNAERVVLEGIIVIGCSGDGCLINKCQNVEVTACEFNSNGKNGIVCNYSDGVFRDCIAHDNTRDGFNLNYYGDTQFYNCSGYDNGDDGISHHQGTTGLIDGGEWYGNTKGGVASPCFGAIVDVRNVYSHDNGYGIYARAGIATNPAVGRTFRVWNCVLTNNSQYGLSVEKNSAIIYGNKIAGNTVGQTVASVGGTITTLD